MDNFNKKIEGIRNMIKVLKAHMYAIQNPKLVGLDEYVKGLYLKFLCTVIQYENDPSEMQILFLKRIVNGIGVDDTAEEFMRKALEITEDNIQELLSVLSEGEIKYYFAFDGLLLVSMGNKTKNNYEYLAELIEILGVSKEDLEYISTVAQSVLRQESRLYDEAKDLVNERVRNLDFTPYIQNYYVGAVIDTDIEKHYSAPDKKKSDIVNCPLLYKERYVTFENLILKIQNEWIFKGCEKVIFRNCEFIGDNNILRFNMVGTIVVESCRFSNFTDGISIITSANHIFIRNTEFVECGKTCVTNGRGGMFLLSGNSAKEIEFTNNKLLNCYVAGRGSGRFGATGVLMLFDEDSGVVENLTIASNEFTGCDCRNNGLYKAALISGCYARQITENGNQYSGGLQRMFE